MFTLSHEEFGECTRKYADPLEVREIRPYEHSVRNVKEDFLEHEQISMFMPHIKHEGAKGKNSFPEAFSDVNILVDLLWASRDPGARDCPLSRGEIQRRLYGNGKANNKKKCKKKDKQQILEGKTIYVGGIGEMAASDESAGANPDVLLSSSEDDRIDLYNRFQQASTLTTNDRISNDENLVNASDPCHKEYRDRFELSHDPSKSKDSLNNKEETMMEQSNGLSPASWVSKSQSYGVSSAQLSVFSFPDRSRYSPTRIDNTVHLLRSPIQLVHVLLQHLISSLIAMHNFGDAVYLFGIYLLLFPRPSYSWINIDDFRLFQRFFTAAADVLYSTMRIQMLEQCFGNPTFLRHDILYDVTFLYCIRREPDKAIEFLERHLASRVATDQLVGTLNACMAWALYSKLLKERCMEHKIAFTDRKSVQDVAVSLVNSRSIENLRRLLDTAVLHHWKYKMVINVLFLLDFPNESAPSFDFLQYFLRCTAEKVWSFVQDFLAIGPAALDLLEIKIILLQSRIGHWDMNDYIASSINKSNDEFNLADTVLYYSDTCRGEPAGFNLAIQSFTHMSIVDRLRCIFLFLNSNPFNPLFWRVLVDETLGFLGDILLDTSLANHVTDDAMALWTLVDQVLGPTEKLHWYRRLFDAERTCLSQISVGSQIFVLLIAPFFVSTWEKLVHLARFISVKSFCGKRKLSVVVSQRQFSKHKFFTLPNSTEMDFLSPYTYKVLTGFSNLLAFVFENDSQTNPSSRPCLVLNTQELELLTEAALRLTPRTSFGT